jgi:hypothetical protein
MVIHDLDFVRAILPPIEANPIPVIDSNTVLSFPIACQLLQMKAGKLQVAQAHSGVQNPQLLKRRSLHGLELAYRVAVEELAAISVREGSDHRTYRILHTTYGSRSVKP